MDDIAPCPLCGGEAMMELIAPHQHNIATFMPDYEGGCVISCGACALAIIRENGDYKAECVAAWNRRPASTPPGDACVRHACKRVRMEMQARIDALSQPAAAEVDLLDALLKRPNRVWQSSGHYSAELARGIVVDPIELRALAKGDSHAG